MKFTRAVALLTAIPASAAFSSRSALRRNAFGTAKPLFGIMDEVNSDAFDLISQTATQDTGGVSKEMNAAYESFLAELVFSASDPRLDIANNYERCADPEWLDWLDKKVENSRDAEERMALRDLYEMILDVKKKVEISKLVEEKEQQEAEKAEEERVKEANAQAEAGLEMSAADVLKKANSISNAEVNQAKGEEVEKKKTFYDLELTSAIRMSYEDMVKKVLPPYKTGETPQSIVFTYYDQFDAQFVKVLTERAENGDEDSRVLLAALAAEQAKRMEAATVTLKEVLSLGDPMRMEGALVRLAREGKVDEPFLLLLEANAQQAMDAGATGPAELMKKLLKRANDEKDKQSASKEIKLLRKLLRTDESSEREALLEEAFTPKDALIVEGTAENAQRALDGERPEEEKPMPEVPPPDFINACKAVLLNFGNIGTDDDRGDLASRIKDIAAEAEVVATRIYGKGMSLREQQDRMWKEQTTSIFDLERMELEAESMGESAPWTNPDAGDDMMPGFDAQGRMKIGGI